MKETCPGHMDMNLLCMYSGCRSEWFGSDHFLLDAMHRCT